MKPTKYLNTVLTVIALLLVVIAFQMNRARGIGTAFNLVEPVLAQEPQRNQDVVFAAWFNPRRFIFWDKQSGLIYIYMDDGKIDATWELGKLGEPLHKK